MPPMPMSEPELRSKGAEPQDLPTSQVLAGILATVPRDRVSAGWLVDQLQGRAFGILLVVLAALTVIPGIATLSALLLILPALQMISGRTAPALPGPVRRLSAPGHWFSGPLPSAIVNWVDRLERYFVPRLPLFTRPPFINAIGVIVLGLSVAALCPVPLFHIVPALAVMVIAVGLLEQDGVALLIGVVLGGAAIVAGFEVWRLVLLAVVGLWGV